MASNTTPHHSGNSSLKFTKVAQGMKIYPKNFNIVWGNDTRYWNVHKNTDLAAELCQVSWLEVTGGVVGTKAGKSYEFEIKGRLMMKGSDHQIEGSDDGKLSFGLYEVWSGKWKGGLKIHHAFVKEC
ncbi:hypothetical protein SASPL_142008 [Salvia splendens]|uniref:Uncharacterized protein n=1 Tax=Salvia splendens TaxID=180675 RepID=A0A8X8WJF6_SALSN|nr:hypothetical protein SASPL_142008 [Salvia splendens]